MMRLSKLHIFVGLCGVLATTARTYYEPTSAPEIGLPQHYTWLQRELESMSMGGATPQLSEEQWIELRILMQEDNFAMLSNLLMEGGMSQVLP